MTSNFKVTTWEGHDSTQIKSTHGSIYLDGDDITKLREHLMQDVVKELERLKGEKRISLNISDAIILIRDGVKHE